MSCWANKRVLLMLLIKRPWWQCRRGHVRSQVYVQPIACRFLSLIMEPRRCGIYGMERASYGLSLYNSTSFLVEAGIGACLVRSHPTTSLFSCARGRGFRSTFSGERELFANPMAGIPKATGNAAWSFHDFPRVLSTDHIMLKGFLEPLIMLIPYQYWLFFIATAFPLINAHPDTPYIPILSWKEEKFQ